MAATLTRIGVDDGLSIWQVDVTWNATPFTLDIPHLYGTMRPLLNTWPGAVGGVSIMTWPGFAYWFVPCDAGAASQHAYLAPGTGGHLTFGANGSGEDSGVWLVYLLDAGAGGGAGGAVR